MLRISEQSSAEYAKRCYAAAGYYRDGRGIIGFWGGKGACRLGLKGTVDPLSFRRLCDNQDPRTGTPVTVRTRSNRTVGYTFRFSVSKSVSLLDGMSGDWAILDVFRAAVGESMCEMEGEMKARVRKARQNTARTTGNMVWAEFIHRTSSPVGGLCDPQLQAYVFVFNMTWDEQESRWKAGRFRDIKTDAPYFEAAFRVRVANKLQDLGFRVQRKRKDFEIAGIPADVLKRFSRRTERIERVARDRGITHPEWKAALGPKTREKWTGIPKGFEALRKEWKTRLTAQERQLLASVYRRETPCAREVNGETVAVDLAIAHCFAGASMVPERKLVTEALKHGIGTVTIESVTRELGHRPLIWSDVAGRKMAALRP
ncbi:relaxase domain-containing protein [bacterium]|nr:relaxase domain-containing protein [bacterium]